MRKGASACAARWKRAERTVTAGGPGQGHGRAIDQRTADRDAIDLRHPRIVERLGGWSVGGEGPVGEEDHAVGEAGGQRDVVRDGNHQRAAPRLRLQQAHDRQLMPWIERGRRLVGEDDRRVRRQDARQHDARPLAAGQRLDIAIGEAEAIRALHGGLDDPAIGLAQPRRITRAGGITAERHDIADGEGPVSDMPLGQVGNAPRPLLQGQGRHVRACEEHAARRRDQARNRPEQRGLPSPVRPKEGRESAALQVGGDLPKHLASREANRDV